MSNRNKNEICLDLWSFYKGLKTDGLDTASLKDGFKHELLLGSRVESRNALDNAAENVIRLQTMESMVLKNKGFLISKQRLTFKESSDQIVRSMVGSMILEKGFTTDGRVRILKTDGEADFELFAENPLAGYFEGMMLWVAEPFIVTEEAGKTWIEMTKEEREAACKEGSLKNASNMPKYLQKRRATISEMKVMSDDVNAWIEFKLVPAEPFERVAFEEDELLKELGIEKESAAEDEPTVEQPIMVDDHGVDISEMDHTELEVPMEQTPIEKETF